MARRYPTFDVVFDLGIEYPQVGLGLAVAASIGAACLKFIGASALGVFTPLATILLWFVGAFGLVGSLAGYLRHAKRHRILSSQRRLDDLRGLTWKQFEELVADLFRKQRFRVHEVGGAHDRGIDLVLRGPTSVKHAVQCKRWRARSVGVAQIREFVGALTISSDHSGIYVTCGCYTPEAKKLGREQGIDLIDGVRLLQLLEEVQTAHPPARRFTTSGRRKASYPGRN